MSRANRISISVGIPTVNPGSHLIKTIDSLRMQTVSPNMICVLIDGGRLKNEYKNALKNLGVKLVYKRRQKGQSSRINNLLKIHNSDLTVLINDDVILEQNALESILQEYIHNQSDLICVNVNPIASTTIVEYFLRPGTMLRSAICTFINKPHYLMCNGRCIAVSKKLSRSLKIPEYVWNNDAYIFLYSKINKYKISYIKNVLCYFKDPETVTEYLKQTQKFQYSLLELRPLFTEIKNEYFVSLRIRLFSFILVLLRNPIGLTGYLILYLLSRISKKDYSTMKIKTFWQTDITTKRI